MDVVQDEPAAVFDEEQADGLRARLVEGLLSATVLEPRCFAHTAWQRFAPAITFSRIATSTSTPS